MRTSPSIAIIDYGVGNLYSIVRAVTRYTADVVVTDEPSIIASAQKIILPGVGSFQAGVAGIAARNLKDVLKAFAASGRPILGICLGAQLLMTRGFEFGTFQGLDIIPGDVVPFASLAAGTKIPHIGWNQITFDTESTNTPSILGSRLNGAHVYFNHSYILQPTHAKYIAARTSYGGKNFCSMVSRDNVYGVQFHPEKSGEVGMAIIKNFITHTP